MCSLLWLVNSFDRNAAPALSYSVEPRAKPPTIVNNTRCLDIHTHDSIFIHFVLLSVYLCLSQAAIARVTWLIHKQRIYGEG